MIKILARQFFASVFLLAAPVLAMAQAPADVPGWRAARWGMTEAELVVAFGPELTNLPGRWIYGGAYADHAVFDVVLAGQSFIAYMQMNDETNRLQQVLLERRPRDSAVRSFEAIVAALQDRYGAPASVCFSDDAALETIEGDVVWRFATTTVHASYLDMTAADLLYEDPNRDRDPLERQLDRRRINPRFLPRRLLVRFHSSERKDLEARDGCDLN